MSAPVWDGVPLNPERDGCHWLCISQATGAMMAFQWHAPPGPDRIGAWANISRNITTSHPLDAVRMGLTYVAPCILPADHAAAVEAAVQAERELGLKLNVGLATALAKAREDALREALLIAEPKGLVMKSAPQIANEIRALAGKEQGK